MKYLIFSDLHGSLRGLAALEEAVATHRPDVLLCLGDILYGAGDQDANKCAEGLKNIGVPILAVRGNCDYRDDKELLGFDLPDGRSLARGMHEIHMSHRPLSLAFPPGDIVMNGHTHFKVLYKENGVLRLNPGSIALPRDRYASYAIIDEVGAYLYNADDGSLLQKEEF